MENILPVLDITLLQEKANEFAMKGAIKSLEEFYSGYSSPFRKAIDSTLEAKGTSIHLDLPDIIGLLNDMLSDEVDKIANLAIAKTFIPQAKRLLTRAEAKVNFSDILKEFIENTDSDNYDYCEVNIEEHERWGWLNIRISSEKANYSFTLHLKNKGDLSKAKTYHLCGLPYNDSKSNSTFRVYIEDNMKIEMPFTGKILHDRFMSYMGSLIISESIITMDVDSFSEDMFPEGCHCD